MKLVIDANILFAALIKNAETREVLLSGKHELYSPDFLQYEIQKYVGVLVQKTGLSEEEVRSLIDEIITAANITFITFEAAAACYDSATKISPDKEDIPYFALALLLKCDIWSNDKKLKEQDVVNIYATHDILHKAS